MITIPEGMGLEAFGQSNIIDSVGPKKKSRYMVVRGQIAQQAAENMDYDDVMAREGQPAARPRVAEVEAGETRAKKRYIRPAKTDALAMPQQRVKVVGPNQIVPVGDDPDFAPVRGKVVETELFPVQTKGQVAIYNDDPTFKAKMRKTRGPRTGRPYWQAFPGSSEMEAPDKLLYKNPISDRPSWKERQDIHEDYDKEGEAAANEFETARIPDGMSIGQFDVLLTVASTAIQAGATGFKAYTDLKRAKEERKSAAEANAAQAAQTAALLKAQFGPAPAAPGTRTLAPTEASVDWTKIAIFGVGGVAVLSLAYVLLR